LTDYRVCFLNDIPRNDKLFRCCQRSFVVRSSQSPDEAAEAAKREFAHLEGIRDWRTHAAQCEIQPIELEARHLGGGGPRVVSDTPRERSVVHGEG